MFQSSLGLEGESLRGRGEDCEWASPHRSLRVHVRHVRGDARRSRADIIQCKDICGHVQLDEEGQRLADAARSAHDSDLGHRLRAGVGADAVRKS